MSASHGRDLDGITRSYDAGEPLCGPINAVLNVQPACNSRCAYCESWKQAPADHEEWFDIVDQLSDLGVREVVISGGEPLMYEGLDDLVTFTVRRDMRCHIVTNGILLTKERAQRLMDAGLTDLTMSLDTLDPANYLRTRGVPITGALRGLDMLTDLAEGYPESYLAINCVVTWISLPGMAQLVAEAATRGLRACFQCYTYAPAREVRDLRPPPGTDREVAQAIDQLLELKRSGAPISTSEDYLRGIPAFLSRRALPEDFRCYAGYIGANIDAQWQLRSCWMMKPVGSLRERSLADLWSSAQFGEARARMARLDCDRCWLLCHTDIDGICRTGQS